MPSKKASKKTGFPPVYENIKENLHGDKSDAVAPFGNVPESVMLLVNAVQGKQTCSGGSFWTFLRVMHSIMALLYLISAILGFILIPVETDDYHLHSTESYMHWTAGPNGNPSYVTVAKVHYAYMIPSLFVIGFLAHTFIAIFYTGYRSLLSGGLQPVRWVAGAVMTWLLNMAIAYALGHTDITTNIAFGFVGAAVAFGGLTFEIFAYWATRQVALMEEAAKAEASEEGAKPKKNYSFLSMTSTGLRDTLSTATGSPLQARLVAWGSLILPIIWSVLGLFIMLGGTIAWFALSNHHSAIAVPAFMWAAVLIYWIAGFLIVVFWIAIALNWYLNPATTALRFLADPRVNDIVLSILGFIWFAGTGWALAGGLIHHF